MLIFRASKAIIDFMLFMFLKGNLIVKSWKAIHEADFTNAQEIWRQFPVLNFALISAHNPG